jgi:hypothetical protein
VLHQADDIVALIAAAAVPDALADIDAETIAAAADRAWPNEFAAASLAELRTVARRDGEDVDRACSFDCLAGRVHARPSIGIWTA